MRATEDHLKVATSLADPDKYAEFEQWPWEIRAEWRILDTEEWRKFKKYRQELEDAGRQFMEEGHDILTHAPYLALYRRFEKYVIEPLEEKWQELLLVQERIESASRKAGDYEQDVVEQLV